MPTISSLRLVLIALRDPCNGLLTAVQFCGASGSRKLPKVVRISCTSPCHPNPRARLQHHLDSSASARMRTRWFGLFSDVVRGGSALCSRAGLALHNDIARRADRPAAKFSSGDYGADPASRSACATRTSLFRAAPTSPSTARNRPRALSGAPAPDYIIGSLLVRLFVGRKDCTRSSRASSSLPDRPPACHISARHRAQRRSPRLPRLRETAALWGKAHFVSQRGNAEEWRRRRGRGR
jgi:hypothetical protein